MIFLTDLKTIQKIVAQIDKSRGHDKESILEKMLLYLEESGELAKAIREREGIELHTKTERYSIADELADKLFLLGCVANYYNIDLEAAFMEKMKKDMEKIYLPC